MIKGLFYVLMLLMGISAGLFLVKLCSDEIRNWSGRLKLIIGVCIVLILVLAISSFAYKVPTIISLLFVIIVNLVILKKSY
jgi:hypothetical protein